MKRSLTREKLEELFRYNPETGIFTNNFSRGRARTGQRAGSPSGHGYRKIVVGYDRHYEHHLAWLYVYGEYPQTLDHVDGNRGNNAIANLRLATKAQNRQNSRRSELPGAYLDKRVGKWYSKIQLGQTTHWLGYFSSAQAAAYAYRNASIEAYGEFSVYNRNTQMETL